MADNSSAFKVLSDVDHIRTRPGMYIGETNNPTSLMTEIIDNALDEMLNNYATSLNLSIDPETLECTVEDNGRGIIQGSYDDESSPHHGEDIIKLICTKNFSGEKFLVDAVYGKKVGLHGVGAVTVNALSEYLIVKVYDGKIATEYKFEKGSLVSKTQGKSDKHKKYKGTTVIFKPSSEFFDSLEYDTSLILQRLKMFKYLYRKSQLVFNNSEIQAASISDIHKSFNSKLPVLEIEGENYYFAITYNLEDTQSRKYGYVNLLPVNEGTHINFIVGVLRDVWQNFVKTSEFEFERDDCFLGSSILFSCYLSNPTFDSQTKNKLTVSKNAVKDIANDLEQKLLKTLLKSDNYNKFTKPLLLRFSDYRKSLKKLKVIDYLKEAMTYGDITDTGEGKVRVSRNITNSKLLDCTSTDREETELYIVEGDSAGGSIKQCRDIKRHAILPLRGKPLNVANMDLKDIVKNVEFQSLINAMGCGVFPLERVDNIRYGKIILCADADVDGKSIEAILLGGFLKLFPGLVSGGRLYICEAPLFMQNGKYYWSQSEIDLSKKFQRYKGLGEMNSSEIFESMIKPENRRLLRVVVQDSDDRDYALQLVSSSAVRKLMLTENGYLE